MATYQVIADMGETLVDLLTKETAGMFSQPPPVPPSPEVIVELETPDKFADHEHPKIPTISIFLYRIAINSETRCGPRRVLSNGASTRPLLPLELSYFITPWAIQTKTEHVLAGKILQVFYDHAELERADLKGNSWGPEDSAQLILESLPTTEHYQIWETTKLPYRMSLTYTARVIGIEPSLAMTYPPVVEAILGGSR